jgi:hypothetical protein
MTFEEDYPVTAGTKASAKKVEKEQVTIASKRVAHKSGVQKAAITKPIVFTFTDGPVAGVIKFIRAGDTYVMNSENKLYPSTKITIQTVGQKEAFGITQAIYYALMDSLKEPLCREQIKEWEE